MQPRSLSFTSARAFCLLSSEFPVDDVMMIDRVWAQGEGGRQLLCSSLDQHRLILPVNIDEVRVEILRYGAAIVGGRIVFLGTRSDLIPPLPDRQTL